MKHFSLRNFWAVGLAVCLIGGSLSQVQAAPFFKHMRKGVREKIAAELNLTDTQKQQIKAIIEESRMALKPVHEKLATERKALRDVMSTTPVNEGAIRAQSAKVEGLETDLRVQRAKVMERITTTVLTPEQAAKAKELRAKREARGERFREKAGKRFKKENEL